MYGWRARIGHVAPSRGDTLVYEFYKMFPEGFMILNTTGTVRQLVDADFDRQRQRIEEAVQDLVESARKPSGSVLGVVFGVVLLVIGSTAVFAELQDALDRIWRVPAGTGGITFGL